MSSTATATKPRTHTAKAAPEAASAAPEAKPAAPRRSRKAAPAAAPAQPAPQAEKPSTAPKARARKAGTAKAPAAPQQPAEQPKAGTAPRTPRLDQAALVLAFLAEHPAESFTPYEIARKVTPEGRKQLGLRDCTARLAKNGLIERVSEKPLKYRALPA